MHTETVIKIFIKIVWVVLAVCGVLVAWHGWNVYESYRYYHDDPVPVIEGPIALNKVYVINLDRSKERYAKIKANLDSLGIRYARFKAVDGYDLDIENDVGQQFKGADLKSGNHSVDHRKPYKVLCPAKTLIHHPVADTQNNKRDKAISIASNTLLSAGEYGCYCSHLGIWQEIINKNIDYALILEDDARLTPESVQKLDQILKHAPKDFDIIFLHIRYGRFKKFNPHIKVAAGPLTSMAAYIVSINGAKKLWQQINAPTEQIDHLISHLTEKNLINSYAGINNIFTALSPKQYPHLSIIGSMLPKNCAFNRTDCKPDTHLLNKATTSQ